ncbi:MAG TPA: DUF4276 family protein [Planctomycetaceae bacterium]|nr:DUF4276 family protein [Planctomycetaceae bacterium]
MTNVRLYVEGGGDQKNTKQLLQNAIGAFLANGLAQFGTKRRPKVIVWGANLHTLALFSAAISKHSQSVCVLLVDADGPVDCAPAEQLRRKHDWRKPQAVSDEQVHLMVQTMEAWIVADREALRDFYGPNLNEKQLSGRDDVEEIPTHELLEGLKRATRSTRKGEYHKIRHASILLQRINAGKAASRARHLKSLLEYLAKVLGS